MSLLTDKGDDEVLDYIIDWSDLLAGEGNDTIATSTWTLLTGDVTIDAETETTTSSTVWLSGGTAGTSALLLCTITTAGARTFERTIRLRIVAAE